MQGIQKTEALKPLHELQHIAHSEYLHKCKNNRERVWCDKDISQRTSNDNSFTDDYESRKKYRVFRKIKHLNHFMNYNT